MSVGNANVLERRWQCIAVELGIAPRPRDRPHIEHAGGPMRFQQMDEFLDRPGRVSDGEHRRRSFGLFVFGHGKEFCFNVRISPGRHVQASDQDECKKLASSLVMQCQLHQGIFQNPGALAARESLCLLSTGCSSLGPRIDVHGNKAHVIIEFMGSREPLQIVDKTTAEFRRRKLRASIDRFQ